MRHFAGCLLGAALLASSAAAKVSPGRADEAWRACSGENADAAIAGCSFLIGSRAEVGENLALARFNRGNAWRAKDEPSRAIADYGRALRLMPRFAGALVNRGIAWYQLRRFDRAIADYDAAIRLQPDLAEAHNNRALAWHKLGDYARAKTDFDRTIQLNQNYGNALINRALPSSLPLRGRDRPN